MFLRWFLGVDLVANGCQAGGRECVDDVVFALIVLP